MLHVTFFTFLRALEVNIDLRHVIIIIIAHASVTSL